MTTRSRPVQPRRATAAALTAATVLVLGAGLALPAHATVTMIMSAFRNVGPDPRADGGVPNDEASRVRGFAETGGFVGGKANVEVFPGQSMGSGCPSCGTSVSGNVSETAASVDADIGRLRGWSFASGNENVGGTVLAGQSLTVTSNAEFGWSDTVTVSGGILELVLSMHASWSANGPLNPFDSTLHRSAASVLHVSLSLMQEQCTPEDGCAMETLGSIRFEGGASEFDGNFHQGYDWIIPNENEHHPGASSLNDVRTLRLDGLDDGDYQLVVEGLMGTAATGRAGASIDFSNTGYVGLVGSYVSQSGYRYPGTAITDPGNGVPTPASLPLVLAGIALAAVATTRRRLAER